MTDFLGKLEDLFHWHHDTPEPVENPLPNANSIPAIEAPPSVTVPPPIVLTKQLWPLQKDCLAFYGNPADPNWLKENTISVMCPWILRMDKIVLSHILIHKKCAGSLTRVLNSIWEAAGKSQAAIEKLHYDKYSGSYNFRPIRGSTAGVLSMHSYAVAIDWDADENQQHSMKHLFQEDSLLVVKFKEEGWTWGGDWSPGSIDAMHVQAARVR